MDECRIKAPAKINLSLDITDKRCDGYHIMRMVMQSVSLFDYVTVKKLDDDDSIKITCDKDFVPTDGSNIACKAANAFFEYTGFTPEGLLIDIEKNIPMEAGLAGGSADAAAVLVALNHMYEARLTESELCDIGVEIGADVPFCIVGGTVIAEGIGDILEKLPDLSDCYFVIVKPNGSVKTPNAFSLFDALPAPRRRPDTDMVIASITAENLDCLGGELCNVLEEVCGFDEVFAIKDRMMQNDALGALMSGSGTAVFGLFDSKSKAKRCAAEFEDAYESTFVVTPCNHGAVISDD